MSEGRELVDRLAEIDATPRARWVAELRADLHAAWDSTALGGPESLPRTTVTLVDNESTPSEPSGGLHWLTVVAAAAAVGVIVVGALSFFRGDDGTPTDQPSPAMNVPFASAAQRLRNSHELLELGAYFVHEVDGTRTPRIFFTIGAGWSGFPDAGLGNDAGFLAFSRPDRVYLDACHLDEGFHPGPVATVDGLVTALREQRGWVDVTVPSDVSVDGYAGKTFQRGAPEVLSGCHRMTVGRGRLPELDGYGLHSWLNEGASNFAGSYYEPGQFETLIVLDIDGTVVVIHSNLWAGASAADRAEFTAVLDSIRIARALPNTNSSFEPGTYFVDEVSGTPTPRIFATLGAGWWDLSNGREWLINKWQAAPNPDLPHHEYVQPMVGYMGFSRPATVYADACHWEAGTYQGNVTTLDGLVAALTEQQGWAQMTAPSDISIDGYPGKAFQRTAPTDMSNCSTRLTRNRVMDQTETPQMRPDFRSWTTPDDGWSGSGEPGQIETLWVLDLNGTLVVISTGAWPEPSAGASADFANDVLHSIRIDPA